ncbi:glycoside hydrolase family 18 protein [Paxillus rubicundulus Ve08.2h10]|uniref:Glycoside hydrolase family 18 protein n=1 Tax=Paxillus rubicundulus Ve08.2h10 TaxID=930991 RepID=A0A0D0D898_9AGAM|nr:glycoside hydrolase family 18 protein [Paxillus rubicundulus Ve08.2h10]
MPMLSLLTLPLLALSFALPQASARLQNTRHHHRAEIPPTQPVAAAWYTGWRALDGLPLSHVSWDKYNTLIYAVAATTPSVHNLSLDASEPTVLPQFVDEAHKHVSSDLRSSEKGACSIVVIGRRCTRCTRGMDRKSLVFIQCRNSKKPYCLCQDCRRLCTTV